MRRGQNPVGGDYAPAAADADLDDEGPRFALRRVPADDSMLKVARFHHWLVAAKIC